MKRIQLLLLIISLAFNIVPSYCIAENTLSEAIRIATTSNVPFDLSKRFKIPTGTKGGGYFKCPDTIPDRVYTNVQLTQYTRASTDPARDAILLMKFVIPNSNRLLLVVSFGNYYGGDETISLCVVNQDGTIVSTLLGSVTGNDAYVKQCRINAQHQVVVTTIIPNSRTSIPLVTFTSFDGHRKDITYSIDSKGQFFQVAVQNYTGKTYTRTYLEDMSKNLWDGGETPLK